MEFLQCILEIKIEFKGKNNVGTESWRFLINYGERTCKGKYRNELRSIYLTNNYRGLISSTNSDMVGSLPIESESPAGMSEAAARLVTPLGHSLVILN